MMQLTHTLDDLYNKEPAKDLFTHIKKSESVIVSGPPGCGKSATLSVIADSLDYELTFIDDENSCVNCGSEQKSFFKKGKIIVIDLDCFNDFDKIKQIIEKSKFPIVMETTDVYSLKLMSFRKAFKAIKFRPLPSYEIQKILRTVSRKLNLDIDEKKLYAVSNGSNGDLRAAIHTLIYGESHDSAKNAFEVIDTIGKGKLTEAKNSLSNLDQDIFALIQNQIDMRGLFKWNINFAKADLYKARIRRKQAWNLEKYYLDFLAGMGVR